MWVERVAEFLRERFSEHLQYLSSKSQSSVGVERGPVQEPTELLVYAQLSAPWYWVLLPLHHVKRLQWSELLLRPGPCPEEGVVHHHLSTPLLVPALAAVERSPHRQALVLLPSGESLPESLKPCLEELCGCVRERWEKLLFLRGVVHPKR